MIERLKETLANTDPTKHPVLVEMLEDRIRELEHRWPATGSLWVDGSDGSNWRVVCGRWNTDWGTVAIQRPHRLGPIIERRVRARDFLNNFRCLVE
jgi:hypothetical protein